MGRRAPDACSPAISQSITSESEPPPYAPDEGVLKKKSDIDVLPIN
jgi:hypothetical protein